MTGLSRRQQDRLWRHYQSADAASFAASETRLRWLARRLAPGARTLNVGVGGGQFERLALERGLDVYALDPDERAIQIVRERHELGERAQVGYLEQAPFPADCFDAVVVSEVLEHLPDDTLAAALAELARLLRPGGRLLGTVPAREDLASERVLCPHCGEPFHRWGHEQSFTVGRVREVLAERFVVDDVRERQFVHWPQLNWRGKLLAAARLALGPWVSSGKTITFAAHKAPTAARAETG